MKHLVLLVALLLAAPVASAQTYEEILAKHPAAQEMQPIEATKALERPHSQARVMATLSPADIVLAFEQIGPWWKVATLDGGYVGYVRATLLAPYSPPAQPVAQAVQHQAPNRAQPSSQLARYRVGAKGTRIYAEPNASSELVMRLNEGFEVEITERSGTFYAVSLPGQGAVGYAKVGELEPIVPLSTLGGGAVNPNAGYKDPNVATLLSVLITGGGQLYSGDPSGALLFLGSLGAVVAGVAISSNAASRGEVDLQPLYLGIGVAGVLWVAGVADAAPSARRANIRNGYGQPSASLSPQLFQTAEGMRPGLSLTVSM